MLISELIAKLRDLYGYQGDSKILFIEPNQGILANGGHFDINEECPFFANSIDPDTNERYAWLVLKRL